MGRRWSTVILQAGFLTSLIDFFQLVVKFSNYSSNSLLIVLNFEWKHAKLLEVELSSRIFIDQVEQTKDLFVCQLDAELFNAESELVVGHVAGLDKQDIARDLREDTYSIEVEVGEHFVELLKFFCYLAPEVG